MCSKILKRGPVIFIQKNLKINKGERKIRYVFLYCLDEKIGNHVFISFEIIPSEIFY